MIEIQLKPASTQGRHFLLYKGARDWWVKLAFSDSSARILSGLALRMETGKLWRWAEKSVSVRKLVTKPEARQGKITQWFEPTLLSLPNRAHLIVCLK